MFTDSGFKMEGVGGEGGWQTNLGPISLCFILDKIYDQRKKKLFKGEIQNGQIKYKKNLIILRKEELKWNRYLPH